MTQEDAIARVARGAALLDEKRPGWAEEINTGTLSIARDRLCVLGQLCGSFGTAIATDAIGMREPSCNYGFAPDAAWVYADSPSQAWADGCRQLQDIWIEAIADRLMKPKPAPTPDLVAVPA